MNAQHMGDRWKLSIDVFEQRLIAGWAQDAATPDRAVMIELSSTTGEKFICQADIFRKDLSDANIGTGRYGFEINISTWDIAGQSLTIKPIADDADSVYVTVTSDLASIMQDKAWYQTYKNLISTLMISV